MALTGLAPSAGDFDLIDMSDDREEMSDDESDTEDNGDELPSVDMNTIHPNLKSNIVAVNLDIARMEKELQELRKEKKKIDDRLDGAMVSSCSVAGVHYRCSNHCSAGTFQGDQEKCC